MSSLLDREGADVRGGLGLFLLDHHILGALLGEHLVVLVDDGDGEQDTRFITLYAPPTLTNLFWAAIFLVILRPRASPSSSAFSTPSDLSERIISTCAG